MIDDTQVDDVFRQWQANEVSAWKIPLLHAIVTSAAFSGKPSLAWRPDGVQNFMHAKVVVADDVSFVGSFNFSRSGERNAENVLEIATRTRTPRALRRRGAQAYLRLLADVAPDDAACRARLTAPLRAAARVAGTKHRAGAHP